MKIVELSEKTICGLGVRTSNRLEMGEGTGKIGELWVEFYNTVVEELKNPTFLYGIYYNYESDQNGEFGVMAGVEKRDLPSEIKLDEIKISDGKYLVFNGEGPLPGAVIDCWKRIWEYFSTDNAKYSRAFKTDFELYKSDTEIEIYISVK